MSHFKNYSLFLLAISMICLSSNSALAKYRGIYKVGNPYQIEGKWYYPEIDKTYNKIGVASWYGDKFHRKKTANGDKFYKNKVTAAHPTLPMPSMVRVTNLENNKSMKILVNDRGPFAKDRIIDLSRKAAKKLGFFEQGTTTVRVEFLLKDTRKLHKKLFGKAML